MGNEMIKERQGLFEKIEGAPLDPILGIKQVFNADDRAEKVDLSIGVYQNDQGMTPTLEVVEEAMRRIPAKLLNGGYLPIEGLADYAREVQKLLFGIDARVLKEGKVVTVQSVGGTGALRYGADFLKRFFAESKVYVSDPSWENHGAIFSRAGFQVERYPYYDPASHGLAFAKMVEFLERMPPREIFVLHAGCHNPTGVDLDLEQWEKVIDVLKAREIIPFFDFAYQGFSEGVDEDAAPLRKSAQAGLSFLVANSFSKNFSLYRRRVGALSIVAGDSAAAGKILTQIRTDIRSNNSNPPVDGAAIVAAVLSDQGLHSKWEHAVSVMRNRIAHMRERFAAELDGRGVGERFKHISKQRGMFSYSGLRKDEVERLRDSYAIYALASGRICVAALTERNLEYVADCIAKVVDDGR